MLKHPDGELVLDNLGAAGIEIASPTSESHRWKALPNPNRFNC
jgi:hypothetical protein